MIYKRYQPVTNCADDTFTRLLLLGVDKTRHARLLIGQDLKWSYMIGRVVESDESCYTLHRATAAAAAHHNTIVTCVTPFYIFSHEINS